MTEKQWIENKEDQMKVSHDGSFLVNDMPRMQLRYGYS